MNDAMLRSTPQLLPVVENESGAGHCLAPLECPSAAGSGREGRLGATNAGRWALQLCQAMAGSRLVLNGQEELWGRPQHGIVHFIVSNDFPGVSRV